MLWLRQSLLVDRILALPVTLCTLYARSMHALQPTIAVAWRGGPEPCSPKYAVAPSCRAVPQGVDLLVREEGLGWGWGWG